MLGIDWARLGKSIALVCTIILVAVVEVSFITFLIYNWPVVGSVLSVLLFVAILTWLDYRNGGL